MDSKLLAVGRNTGGDYHHHQLLPELGKIMSKKDFVFVAFLISGGFYGFRAMADDPSFDCAKVSSQIEKLICSDAGLSRLDKKLGQVYTAMRPNDANGSLLRGQRLWLQQRSACGDRECLAELYAGRILSLEGQQLGLRDHLGKVELGDLDSNWRYERDEEKIPFFRESFSRENLTEPKNYPKNPAFCKKFPQDFLANRFEVVSAIYQFNSIRETSSEENLPSAMRGKLPHKELRASWSQCEDRDAGSSNATGDHYFFSDVLGNGPLNSPPFRFYRAILNENEKTKKMADIVLSHTDESNGHLYQMVDLQKCEVTSGVSVGSPSNKNENASLSFMLRYRGKLMAITYANYESDRAKEPVISIKLKSFSDEEICFWQDEALNSAE